MGAKVLSIDRLNAHTLCSAPHLQKLPYNEWKLLGIMNVVRILLLCFIFRSSRSAQILLPPRRRPTSPKLAPESKMKSPLLIFFPEVA